MACRTVVGRFRSLRVRTVPRRDESCQQFARWRCRCDAALPNGGGRRVLLPWPMRSAGDARAPRPAREARSPQSSPSWASSETSTTERSARADRLGRRRVARQRWCPEMFERAASAGSCPRSLALRSGSRGPGALRACCAAMVGLSCAGAAQSHVTRPERRPGPTTSTALPGGPGAYDAEPARSSGLDTLSGCGNPARLSVTARPARLTPAHDLAATWRGNRGGHAAALLMTALASIRLLAQVPGGWSTQAAGPVRRGKSESVRRE
jgi:hypothetical protein